MGLIYFDQAASSFPKPVEVTEAMVKVMNNVGANPGRGSHQLAQQANAIINKAREVIANWIGCPDPKQVLFYSNATIALNQAIKGLTWQKGDHVITTSFEHNAVRRPLEYIRNSQGINVSYITGNVDKNVFIDDLKREISPNTKLIAVTHASNVTGELMPLKAITALAKEYGILTLVDASQTAGHLSIDMEKENIDILVFPGHKGVLGPQGTGVLALREKIELVPLHHGGTGVASESIEQPDQWPEKYESGTLNTPGIAGLLEAVKVIQAETESNVSRETLLVNKLIKGLKAIDGVTCYGPGESSSRLPIVAFNIRDVSSQEIAMVFDSHYKIAVRAGLHCSPLTHNTLNTLEQGVVRASLSRFNTEEEVEVFLHAVEEIVMAYHVV